MKTESEIGHAIIAKLFELEVFDMGGGLLITEVPYITVEERDLIAKAVHEYLGRSRRETQD